MIIRKTKLVFIPIIKEIYWKFYFKLRRVCKKIK